MLMAADLPNDVEALRAFALEQSRKLAEVTVAKSEADAEIERLQSIIDAFNRCAGNCWSACQQLARCTCVILPIFDWQRRWYRTFANHQP